MIATHLRSGLISFFEFNETLNLIEGNFERYSTGSLPDEKKAVMDDDLVKSMNEYLHNSFSLLQKHLQDLTKIYGSSLSEDFAEMFQDSLKNEIPQVHEIVKTLRESNTTRKDKPDLQLKFVNRMKKLIDFNFSTSRRQNSRREEGKQLEIYDDALVCRQIHIYEQKANKLGSDDSRRIQRLEEAGQPQRDEKTPVTRSRDKNDGSTDSRSTNATPITQNVKPYRSKSPYVREFENRFLTNKSQTPLQNNHNNDQKTIQKTPPTNNFMIEGEEKIKKQIIEKNDLPQTQNLNNEPEYKKPPVAKIQKIEKKSSANSININRTPTERSPVNSLNSFITPNSSNNNKENISNNDQNIKSNKNSEKVNIKTSDYGHLEEKSLNNMSRTQEMIRSCQISHQNSQNYDSIDHAETTRRERSFEPSHRNKTNQNPVRGLNIASCDQDLSQRARPRSRPPQEHRVYSRSRSRGKDSELAKKEDFPPNKRMICSREESRSYSPHFSDQNSRGQSQKTEEFSSCFIKNQQNSKREAQPHQQKIIEHKPPPVREQQRKPSIHSKRSDKLIYNQIARFQPPFQNCKSKIRLIIFSSQS